MNIQLMLFICQKLVSNPMNQFWYWQKEKLSISFKKKGEFLACTCNIDIPEFPIERLPICLLKGYFKVDKIAWPLQQHDGNYSLFFLLLQLVSRLGQSFSTWRGTESRCWRDFKAVERWQTQGFFIAFKGQQQQQQQFSWYG